MQLNYRIRKSLINGSMKMTSNDSPRFFDPARNWIAVIGMGAGGSRVFTDIVDKIRSVDSVANSTGFILIDSRPRSEFGRGVAWSNDQSDLFLANMRLPTMGLKENVLEKIKTELNIVGHWNQDKIPENFQFQVRKIIGQALNEDFEHYVKVAADVGIAVELISQSAIDLNRRGKGFVISLQDEPSVFCDFVILALGNVPNNTFPELSKHKNYVHNPWRWDDYQDRLKDQRVLIMGLGPTAVDAILLARQCGAAQIIATSRSGRMQYPRPKSNPDRPYILRYLAKLNIQNHYAHKISTGQKGINYDELHLLIRSEFHDAQACDELQRVRTISSQKSPRDMLLTGLVDADKEQRWYEIMKAIDDPTPFIWHHLSPDARQKYREDLEDDHTCLSFGMAYKQAERLYQMFDEHGKLIVGKCYGIPKFKGETAQISVDGNNYDVDIVINCTGIGCRKKDFSSKLIRELIDREWLIMHEDGGFLVDFHTGQLIFNAITNAPIGEVYALAGSLTRGTHFLTNCLGQLFASSERTAQRIFERLSERTPHIG